MRTPKGITFGGPRDNPTCRPLASTPVTHWASGPRSPRLWSPPSATPRKEKEVADGWTQRGERVGDQRCLQGPPTSVSFTWIYPRPHRPSL